MCRVAVGSRGHVDHEALLGAHVNASTRQLIGSMLLRLHALGACRESRQNGMNINLGSLCSN